jgi:hypothetical protein
MASESKEVQQPKQLDLPGFGEVTGVFDGQGNKTVACSINGKGYTYPANEVVTVPYQVAEVIGNFTVVK